MPEKKPDTPSEDSSPLIGYTVDWTNGSEEPWEHQISSLLASMPPVEPPPGFLEALAATGPRIAAPFTLDGDNLFAFPIAETEDD